MRFHHVSLIVSDTDRALSFYRDLLGLEVDPNRPDLGYPGAWLNLRCGRSGEVAQIHLLELPDPDLKSVRPEHGGRDHHVALAIDDFKSLIDRLAKANISYTLSKSGRTALFCRDPDKNAVELIGSG